MPQNQNVGPEKLQWPTTVIFSLVIMISCETQDHHPQKTWHFSSAHANVTSCCSFEIDDHESPCNTHNPIFSALLGLTQSEFPEITLSLNNDVFIISHDQQPVISGIIHKNETGFEFSSENDVLAVRSIVDAGDSLLLELDGDGNFSKVKIIFTATTANRP